MKTHPNSKLPNAASALGLGRGLITRHTIAALLMVLAVLQGTQTTVCAQARITSPSVTEPLLVPKFTLRWGAVAGAPEYHLYIGKTVGSYDYYGQSMGANTSMSLTWENPPSQAWFRLWTKTPVYTGAAGSTPAYYTWKSNDYLYSLRARVVLFLHGMNSSPSTWDTVRSDLGFGTMPVVQNGVLSANAVPDGKGVSAYAVRFGAFDSSSGRTGLENVTGGTNYATSGDFESFSTLGSEVNSAVEALIRKFPVVDVVLVGHSRGGLAGRAFLQTPMSTVAKGTVKGFVTTGSPHTGSRLGRIYAWLQANPRAAKQSSDWDVADFVRNYGNLDVRRPTVADLSDMSSAISGLGSSIGNLPSTVTYRGIQYSGYALGRANAGYNFFDGSGYQYGPQVTKACRDNLLGSTRAPADYPGDGIVPSANQAFPGKTTTTYNKNMLHTEEPKQSAELRAGLKAVVTWWN